MKIINNIPADGRFSVTNEGLPIPAMVGNTNNLEQAVCELLLKRFNLPDSTTVKFVDLNGLTYTWSIINRIIEIYQPGSGHIDTYTEEEIDRCLNRNIIELTNKVSFPIKQSQPINKDYLFTKEGIYE